MALFWGTDELIRRALRRSTPTSEEPPAVVPKRQSPPAKREFAPPAKQEDANSKPAETTLSIAERDIKQGLSLLVSGTYLRSEAVAEYQRQCDKNEQKNNSFNSFSESLIRPDAVVGNHALRVAKKDATDAALVALDIRSKCGIVYDENVCVSFIEKHEQIIIREALHTFKRSTSTKNRGVKVTVCDRRNAGQYYTSDITMVAESDDKVFGEAAVDLIHAGPRGVLQPYIPLRKKRKLTTTFTVSGVDPKAVATNFKDKSTSARSSLPLEQRKAVDFTCCEGSHIFTTLHRHDPSRPVLYANETLWQKKDPGEGWTNIVGWKSSKNDAKGAKFLNLNATTMAFILPSSFRQLAATLLDRFRSTLVKSTLPRRASATNLAPVRLINPAIDTPLSLRKLHSDLDHCLDILLAVSRDCTITRSTLDVYRRKFRRYCLFCFVLYLLNRKLHPHVSPLPFSFFNAFIYLYCHGVDMHSSSYLNTLCFLNNYIFKPMGSTSAPTQNMKLLVDLDYAFFKGGKAQIREFGSPAKTSVHTRTVVSFLAFAEMVLGTMCALLSSAKGQIAQHARSTLERMCDGILFVFFTFVFFHRFSGVKKLDMRSALRLILGQPHFHTSKAKAARLVRTRAEAAAKCEYDLAGGGSATRFSGMSISHPHILGLPFGVQARLGVPVGTLFPLVATGKAGVASVPEGDEMYTAFPPGTQYALGLDLAAPPPPAADCVAGELGMFENVVSDILDGFYGSEFTAGMASVLESVMESKDPYSSSPSDEIVLDCSLSPNGPAEESNVSTTTWSTPSSFKLSQELMDYWRASPMKLVFVLVSDTNGGRNRFLSVGDMALLSLWVKRKVLNRHWASPALNPSNYNWLGSVFCRHLLLADLTNFGVWGDVKCDQKFDCTTGRMHKDGIRVPTAREQRQFAKHTSLEDRKNLAIVHSSTNVRTRTHLGRVSSASWAVDAVKTISGGDSAVFTRLAMEIDTYHLTHTNAANFFPYYSSNYATNEDENGLWGFIRRTSAKLAKTEMEKGRFANLSAVGVANTDAAAAAMALIAEVNLGEHEAVLDGASKKAFASADPFSHAAARGRFVKRRRTMEGVLRAAADGGNKERQRPPPHRLKELWGWSTRDRLNLLGGRRIRLLCPKTMFLATAVPDQLLLYRFESGASSLKLAVKRMAQPISNSNDNEMCALTIDEAKQTLADRAVITTDTTVTKYCKFGLAEDESAKRTLRDHELKKRLASGIHKVCCRNRHSGKAEIQDKLAKSLAFVSNLAKGDCI